MRAKRSGARRFREPPSASNVLGRQTKRLSGGFPCGRENSYPTWSELLKPEYECHLHKGLNLKTRDYQRARSKRQAGFHQTPNKKLQTSAEMPSLPIDLGGFLFLTPAKAVKKRPPPSRCHKLARSTLSPASFRAFLHHRDSNVKNCISQTLPHPGKGGLDPQRIFLEDTI